MDRALIREPSKNNITIIDQDVEFQKRLARELHYFGVPYSGRGANKVPYWILEDDTLVSASAGMPDTNEKPSEKQKLKPLAICQGEDQAVGNLPKSTQVRQDSTSGKVEHKSRDRARPTTPCATRNRRKSRSRSSKRDEPCRNYTEFGFCSKGTSCSFSHDYNLPMNSQQLRIMFDGLAGSIQQMRYAQWAITDRINRLDETLTRVLETQDHVIRDLKKLSLSPRDAYQVFHGSDSRSKLKDRTRKYTAADGKRMH